MKKVLKQVLGIDVAQKELVVTLGRTLEDFTIELYAHKVFKNSDSGIRSLLEWVKKHTNNAINIRYVMEATGVYHQKIAYHLAENDYEVSIVLPNKISNYMRTLETKTITDKTCSEAIAQFGLERKLDNWQRPKAVYRNLQQLTRERDQIVAERSIVKNQLHAESSEAYPYQKSIERLQDRIFFLNKQEKEIKQDIKEIVRENKDLEHEVRIMSSIPGVGELTAIIVLAETNGFELIRSKKQLTSYAGLDVKEKQSGTSVKGKPKISKKGNRSLRKAMYLPALSAVKWDERFKAIYARIVHRNGIKMKGLVAVQRKLLEMMYILFKNKNTYDAHYLEKENSVQIQDQHAITG
ncbi:IS110 family RNA-guided transposase [Pedobacter rhizosphaerae]|uniref:Transposase n=1 Tax=Pedobacter rhizosphaerae TaxID=390241 RepID=A0A1H9VS64_9SPHI|nr:IS110 family transposase [Pedobacter rhizosphaerae]SES24227.1 Transposase [Pedobacter rhizosphaerae]SES26403.1 Transposase [Pedobacter rhizosphaerae]